MQGKEKDREKGQAGEGDTQGKGTGGEGGDESDLPLPASQFLPRFPPSPARRLGLRALTSAPAGRRREGGGGGEGGRERKGKHVELAHF